MKLVNLVGPLVHYVWAIQLYTPVIIAFQGVRRTMTTAVSSSISSGLVPLFRPIRQVKGANDSSGSFLSSFRTDTLELKPGFGHGCCARLWAPESQNMEDLTWKIRWVCPQFLDLGDAMEWLQTRFKAPILPKIAASVNLGRGMP